MKFSFYIWVLVGAMLSSGWADEFELESLGARGGTSISREYYEFIQIEAFAEWRLPWRWRFDENWSVRPRADASAGYLIEHTRDAFVGGLGPSLVLERKNCPLFVAGGLSATFIGRTAFETKDFGTRLQFTEHIGLYWEPMHHLTFGYRFHHMSNAGFGRNNPGLNMHMLVLGYHF